MNSIKKSLLVSTIVIIVTFSIFSIYVGINWFFIVLIVGGGLFPLLFFMLYVFNLLLNKILIFKKNKMYQYVLGIIISFLSVVIFLLFDEQELLVDFNLFIKRVGEQYIIFTIFPVFTVFVNYLITSICDKKDNSSAPTQ